MEADVANRKQMAAALGPVTHEERLSILTTDTEDHHSRLKKRHLGKQMTS